MAFELAAGSVIGYDHIRSGTTFIGGSNQDAYAMAVSEQLGFTIGVVCDGCGGKVRSELGAVFTANLVVDRLMQSLLYQGDRWGMIEQWVISDLIELASLYRKRDVSEILFTTIVGFLIHEEEGTVTVFNIGDGYYGVNLETTVLESPIPNTPPYLAYQITGAEEETGEQFMAALGDRPYSFQTRGWPIDDVKSVFVATDGLRYLIPAVGKPLTSKPSQKIPTLLEIMCMNQVFQNPFRLGHLLNAINNEGLIVENGKAKRVTPPLLDDTTIILARRKAPEPEPAPAPELEGETP